MNERWSTDVGLLIASWISASMMEFTSVDTRVALLQLQLGEWVLTVVHFLFGILGMGAGRCLHWG